LAHGDLASNDPEPLRWRFQPLERERRKDVYGGRHVREAFASAGFQGPVDDDDWDLLFTYREETKEIGRRLRKRDSLHNHCNYFRAAGQKCELADHLERLKHSGQELRSWRFLETFRLNSEETRGRWRQAVKADLNRFWVVKPCSATHSSGIQLLRGADALHASENITAAVAQEYVEAPFLGFGGSKFHLRLYILITRWSPSVGAFLFDEGLIFRRREEYDSQSVSLERDVFSGITDEVEPLKVSELWAHLESSQTCSSHHSCDVSAATVRQRIADMLAEVFDGDSVKAFFGRAPRKKIKGYSCFDFYGVDVMLDRQLQPLLLEVNLSPNLAVGGEGTQWIPLLSSIKSEMVMQIATWAALRLRIPPQTVREAEAIEAKTLTNFTRLH